MRIRTAGSRRADGFGADPCAVVAFPLSTSADDPVGKGKDRSCIVSGGARLCHPKGHPRALTPSATLRAVPVAGLEDAVELATDRDAIGGTFCARRRDGHVVCFAGPLVEPSLIRLPESLLRWDGVAAASAPVIIEGLVAKEIVAGAHHACALGEDGRVSCWGDGRHGQLGDGLFRSRAKPGRATGVRDVVAIAATDHATFLAMGGKLHCSGACDQQTRSWTGAFAPLEWRSAPKQPVTKLAASRWSVCFWTASGASCEIGDDDRTRTFDLGANVEEVRFPYGLGLARTTNGRLLGMSLDSYHAEQAGSGYDRLLGPSLAIAGGKLVKIELSSKPMRATPKPFVFAGDLAAEAGYCLLGANGAVSCATYPAPHAPVALPAKAKHIVAGSEFHCALLVDGRVACWGKTALGKLGNGVTSTSLDPSFVHGLP